jgi:hypothetical protein
VSIDYNEVAADALAILEEAGQDILIRVNTPTYDPATRKNTNEPQDLPATGALVSFTQTRTQSDTQEDATAIRSTDKKLIVSPVGLPGEPKTTDKAIVKGVVWNIVACKAIEPAGVPVLYILQVRK